MTVRACDIKWDLIFHKAKLSWDLASLEETSDKTVRESANSCTYLQLPHCSNAPVSHIRPLPGQFDQLRPIFTSPFTCKSERADWSNSPFGLNKADLANTLIQYFYTPSKVLTCQATNGKDLQHKAYPVEHICTHGAQLLYKYCWVDYIWDPFIKSAKHTIKKWLEFDSNRAQQNAFPL